MKTDIIDRIRAVTNTEDTKLLLVEAGEEIKRLRARVSELEAMRDNFGPPLNPGDPIPTK